MAVEQPCKGSVTMALACVSRLNHWQIGYIGHEKVFDTVKSKRFQIKFLYIMFLIFEMLI
jgi:hypothetical protein